MSKLEEYKESLIQAETLLRQCESEVEHYQAMKRAARPNTTGRIANSDREARLRVAQYDCAMKMAQSKVALCKKQIKALKEVIKTEEKATKAAKEKDPKAKPAKKSPAKSTTKSKAKTIASKSADSTKSSKSSSKVSDSSRKTPKKNTARKSSSKAATSKASTASKPTGRKK